MFKETPIFSSYSIKDIEQTLKFYGEVLGINAERTKEGVSLKLKGGDVFLYPKEDHVPATFTVLNFMVDDIGEAVAALESKGVTIERYDTGLMKADEKGIYRGKEAGMGPDIAWFKDPDGNILSVLES